MGRKKKYLTDNEKQQANKDKYMRYYWKNKEKIKLKNLKRYYENKNNK
jgi:hypothetical protein